MKIRTDFVTNSSSSGFVCFHVKSKELLQYLVSLGLRFENTQNDVLTNQTRVILPSGRSQAIVSSDNSSDYPYVTECPSVASWLVAMLIPEAGEYHDEEEFSNFTKELIDLLNGANITHLEWDKLWQWSRNQVISELHSKLGHLDVSIEEAQVEHVYGFEGAADRCAYTRICKEQRILVSFRELWNDTESICKKHFVVTEGMQHFKNRKELVERIIEMGGIVTDQVDEKTNYLICNDIHAQIPELLYARKASIPVLSEIGFIRRFCNVSEFDNIKEISTLAEEAWDMTCCGGLLDFIMNNGIQPVQMQIWQDGEWV